MRDSAKRLTTAQRKLLAELSEETGEWFECMGNEYRTAKALQRRGLIEISEEWGEVKNHDDMFEARAILGGKDTTAADKIKEWSKDLSGSDEVLFVKRLRDFLSDHEIVLVLNVLDGICKECWDSDSGCQCWNDE